MHNTNTLQFALDLCRIKGYPLVHVNRCKFIEGASGVRVGG